MAISTRRAAVLAVTLLTCLLLFKSTHSSPVGRAIAQAGEPPIEHKRSGEAVAESDNDGSDHPHKMGKVRVRRQLVQEVMQETSLLDQLAYQFPYDPESKFPAYIWQTWKYTATDNRFDDIFKDAAASWPMMHPGFVYEIVTDGVALQLMRHLYASTPQVIEAYEALPAPVLKADFFRYLILLARGGIYSDIDTAALKSATDWVPPAVPRSSFGLVIGIEADPDREDWHDWYSRRIQFCQWTIQAKPGHPVLRSVVANITEETLRRKADGTLKKTTDNVIEFTGPALWTDHVFDFFNDPEFFDLGENDKMQRDIDWQDFTGMTDIKKVGDVVVLPITCFSPGVQQMGAGDDDDPMAFVKHGFIGTWKPEYLRHIGEHAPPDEDEGPRLVQDGEQQQQEQ